MKLNELLMQFPFYNEIKNNTNPDVTYITSDSRLIKPGCLFVCVVGQTVDGHDFVSTAEAKGAVCLLVSKHLKNTTLPQIIVKDVNRPLSYLASRLYNDPSHQLHMIGITGTNGKTTLTYILEAIFNKNKEKTGLIGTIQMKIHDQIYKINNTTPEPSYLFNSLQEMVNQGVKHCMMEVSSHALVQGRVRGVDFDIAVFTNLSQDHLDFHKDMDDYQHAKARLFQQLGNHYDLKKPKYAIINLDDPYSQRFKDVTSQPVITYGLTNESDVFAKKIHYTSRKTTFTLSIFGEEIEIEANLIGAFNVYNMLACIATAFVSGVSLSVIKDALKTFSGVKGRFQVLSEGDDVSVIVDYAHTPDSLKSVLKTIKSYAENKIYCVVGCGGNRDQTKRPLMASISEQYSDFTILTSDNPRHEDPVKIIDDMVSGLTTDNYIVEIDRKKAIRRAIMMAEKDDVILIAGKGHETYQIIGDHTLPFDDEKIATDYLQKRGERND